MARSIWSGSISFGLVNVPVKLYTAVSRKTVHFHQLHDADHRRIRQKRSVRWAVSSDNFGNPKVSSPVRFRAPRSG